MVTSDCNAIHYMYYLLPTCTMYMYLHGCIAARLKDELNRLTEALGENEELNKTLRLELSVYDKMAAADNPSSEYRPDV